MLVEQLESRCLFSASSLTQQITTYEAKEKSALEAFRSTADTYMAKMVADEQSLESSVKSSPMLAPAFTAFGQEVATVRQAVDSSKFSNSSAVTKDTSAVAAALKKYAADTVSSADQSSDRAQFLAAVKQLETDETGQVKSQLAARKADLSKLTADASAMEQKVKASGAVSHVETIAMNKFLTDHTSGVSSAMTDLSDLATTQTQLTASLTADIKMAA